MSRLFDERPACDINRVHAATITPEEFHEQYIQTNTPVMLEGAIDDWPAMQKWTPERFLKERPGMRVAWGEEREEKTTYKRYHRYLFNNTHLDPKYVFDHYVFDRNPGLRKEYWRPKWFPSSMLDVVGPSLEFGYEWLLIGPQGSGSFWHLDPMNTSAWNALLHGHKRWALYNASKVMSVPGQVLAHEEKNVLEGRMPSVEWFRTIRPYLAQEHRPLECVQQPGEVIFVPKGWWHAVLNLDQTVAVTQNFADIFSFTEVFEELLRTVNRTTLDEDEVLPNRVYALYTYWNKVRPDLITASQRDRVLWILKDNPDVLEDVETSSTDYATETKPRSNIHSAPRTARHTASSGSVEEQLIAIRAELARTRVLVKHMSGGGSPKQRHKHGSKEELAQDLRNIWAVVQSIIDKRVDRRLATAPSTCSADPT